MNLKSLLTRLPFVNQNSSEKFQSEKARKEIASTSLLQRNDHHPDVCCSLGNARMGYFFASFLLISQAFYFLHCYYHTKVFRHF